MELRDQMIDLVEKFLFVADNMLNDGKIDKKTYDLITENKIKFLELVGDPLKVFGEQDNR